MNRKKRTEILIKGSVKVAQKLSEEIARKYDVKTIEEPNNGLVMVKARETSKGSLFYLGEVLIAESKVLINGCPGIGIVKGGEPDLAYALAVIDAAYNAGLPETKNWLTTLLLEEESIKQNYEAFKNKVLKTKVNFQTMDV
ncbi:alpha-D-ribose 1-methylphosphonate 5-triphosphate synthase subunit PhnG [Desulfotomaculum arcticum]|uniref:Alpha-D-ribose 1-methylphosphonate 5-triphosphate synthase subunit PhnG n=1 Tax=Desulfotruncus arcticus DSM 17038 TaxID=1121424 RepID=A0A1I2V753_9FIRM|nr:phosphonate C-P lyase system protein PhnG [Desulfotruncus arcticus]SFG83166.1 alpha-D-ribose 1-methylphosphonate 5-triphosphate synthase subunit PhnG [Desulfotomaculum arcticum] [Desulfotruncus arcticus DSM 17038]